MYLPHIKIFHVGKGHSVRQSNQRTPLSVKFVGAVLLFGLLACDRGNPSDGTEVSAGNDVQAAPTSVVTTPDASSSPDEVSPTQSGNALRPESAPASSDLQSPDNAPQMRQAEGASSSAEAINDEPVDSSGNGGRNQQSPPATAATSGGDRGLSASGNVKPRTTQDQSEVAASSTAGSDVEDVLLATRVKAALLSSPDVREERINIIVDKGVVYLSGFVETEEQGKEVMRITSELDGVTQVRQQLEVGN